MINIIKKFCLCFVSLGLIIFLSSCTKKLINFVPDSNLVFWNFQSPESFFEKYSFLDSRIEKINIGSNIDIPIYGNFVGDKIFSYGTFRNTGNNNLWSFTEGLTRSTVGEAGDIPVSADYDGDGKFDYIIYRPRNSGFYGQLSEKNKLLEIHLGITGDIPVPKDYDGDGSADLATYRVLGGTWTIRSSKNDLTKQIKFGESGYLPIPNDYDGDGKSDLAVWNHKNNDCKIIFSRFNQKLSDQVSLKIQKKLKDKKCFPISSDFDGDSKSELAFWEYDKNLLHVFNIKDKDFKYEQIEIKATKGSEPINYFLLHRYLNKNYLVNTSTLYDEFKLSLLTKQKDLKTIPFNNATGKQVFGDFDGDGTDDIGLVDLSTKSFTYYSLGLNKLNNLALDKRIDGVPFAYDIDLDFISDLVFYNPKTKIFGFLRSSEDYRYDEILYERYGDTAIR